MPSYIPRSITKPKPYLLSLTWDTGKQSIFMLEKLREECPCAMCKGETIMGTTYVFGIKQLSPGMNDLQSLESVGNYGVQAKWNDGHDSGIYTWKMLYDVAHANELSENDIKSLEQ